MKFKFSNQTEKEGGEQRPLLLVVEDHIDYLSFIVTGLEDEYEVIEAVNGREGWKKTLEELPDLVVTDVMMPYMNGVELCREIKNNQETAHIPVVMLTAKVDVESQLEGLETGADDYITKPFEMELFKARIHNQLESRRILFERFNRNSVPRGDALSELSVDQQLLRQMFSVLEECSGQHDFTVESFAKKMNLSVSSLHRKIKTLTNETPAKLIWNARLEKAAELLRSSSMRITEIVHVAGFAETSHFSRQFRRHYGMSPSEYRRTHSSAG